MKISVIGAAGYVGSNMAIVLALNGLADELVLVDPYKQNIVIQLAMDASTAVNETGVVVKAGDFPDIKDSNIVLVAAGAAQGVIASRMEMLPKNLSIIRDIANDIKKYAPESIVITATNPVDPLNYAMYKFTGFDRRKVIGYSTNDSIRFRMMVAQALGQPGDAVEGLVMGEHGESQVLLWSSLRVNGNPVVIDNAVKARIKAEIPLILKRYEELKTGRTAGVTSAVGSARVVEAIVENTNELLPLSSVLDGEYGQKNMSMDVPCVVGSGGIQEIKELELTAEEKAGLKKTLSVIEPAMRMVDDFVKTA
jgi:malate dehydrogenase